MELLGLCFTAREVRQETEKEQNCSSIDTGSTALLCTCSH
jgi:hypothetical protein